MARPIENTERVTTFVPKNVMDALKKCAKSKGMSASGYIRMLIIEATQEK